MYVYKLYLRHKDTILMILCTGIPITTTVVDEYLNSLIFYDDNKCITANGQNMIYVDINYMSCNYYPFY